MNMGHLDGEVGALEDFLLNFTSTGISKKVLDTSQTMVYKLQAKGLLIIFTIVMGEL